jgi:hypothetical protein
MRQRPISWRFAKLERLFIGVIRRTSRRYTPWQHALHRITIYRGRVFFVSPEEIGRRVRMCLSDSL